jgi:hypothetical protein
MRDKRMRAFWMRVPERPGGGLFSARGALIEKIAASVPSGKRRRRR